MAKEGELIKVHSNLTANQALGTALSHKVFERRRIAVAVHQVPTGAMTGTLSIYGAIKDETGWYELLGNVALNAGAERTTHFNIDNGNSTGAAYLYLRFVVAGLTNGSVDVEFYSVEK